MFIPTTPQPSLNLKTYVPTIRIVHFLIFIAALLQLYVLHLLRKANPQQQPQLESSFTYVIVLAGIISFAVILMLRRTMLEKAVADLKLDPTNSEAIRRWGAASILSTCVCESTFLFGWVLCFMGTPLTWTYILLWSIAAIGFFLFIPQKPVDEMTLMQHNPPPGP